MAKYNDDFRAELKKGFLDAIGKMTDYRIRINAAGWVDKEGLTQDDYLEICHAVEAQYIVPEPPVIEEPVEDTTDEVIGNTPAEETEIEDETILDGEEPTETETEIIEDSTIEEELPETESTEQITEEVIENPVEDIPESEPAEPTE